MVCDEVKEGKGRVMESEKFGTKNGMDEWIGGCDKSIVGLAKGRKGVGGVQEVKERKFN